MSERDKLLALAERVDAASVGDNALDVQVEVALRQEPTEFIASVRANNAGTKVIYTTHDGHQETYWADDWTNDRRRAETASRLRALAQIKRD